MEYAAKRFAFHSGDRCSQNFDLTFDLSVHDLFNLLGRGSDALPLHRTDVDPRHSGGGKGIDLLVLRCHQSPCLHQRWDAAAGRFPRCAGVCSAEKRFLRVWRMRGNKRRATRFSRICTGRRKRQLRSRGTGGMRPTSPAECVRGLVPIGWPFDGQQVCAVNQSLETRSDRRKRRTLPGRIASHPRVPE